MSSHFISCFHFSIHEDIYLCLCRMFCRSIDYWYQLMRFSRLFISSRKYSYFISSPSNVLSILLQTDWRYIIPNSFFTPWVIKVYIRVFQNVSRDGHLHWSTLFLSARLAHDRGISSLLLHFHAWMFLLLIDLTCSRSSDIRMIDHVDNDFMSFSPRYISFGRFFIPPPTLPLLHP